ncbi:MAG: flagellar basal body P-ring formation chaperone FlgA [Rhizobiaceae bacterium]
MFSIANPFAVLLCLAALQAWPAASAEQAIVAKHTIYPGQEIDHSALRVVKLRPGSVAPYAFISAMDDILGKVASRTILAKRYIPVGSVREPSVIQTGQAVRAIYHSGGLLITAVFVALSDGAVGDAVRLRNPSSGKFIVGTVQQNGTVVARVQ